VAKKSRREVKLTLPYREPIRGLSRDVVMVTRVIWKLFIQHAHSTRSELVHGVAASRSDSVLLAA